jgi:hypothetical protein
MYYAATLAVVVVCDTRRPYAHSGRSLSPPLGHTVARQRVGLVQTCSCWVHVETRKTFEVSWHSWLVCRACLAHDRSWMRRPGLLRWKKSRWLEVPPRGRLKSCRVVECLKAIEYMPIPQSRSLMAQKRIPCSTRRTVGSGPYVDRVVRWNPGDGCFK